MQAVKAGKIRYFGLGTSIENVLRALDCEPDLCGVMQFQDSVIVRNRDKLPPQPHKLVITHGSLAGAYKSLSSFFKANNNRAKEWSAGLDLDCSDERTLAALLLNFSVDANPNGLLLFSARSPDRIKDNTRAVLNPHVTPLQVKSFAQLVERNLPALREYP